MERGGEPPIPFSELINVTEATLAAIDSAKTRESRRI